METLKSIAENHKKGEIEMDPEIKLLISNAVMKLEQYKGKKLDNQII